MTPLYEGMEDSPIMKLAEIFGKMVVKGFILVGEEDGESLNERFPELDVTTVEEMIRKTWRR